MSCAVWGQPNCFNFSFVFCFASNVENHWSRHKRLSTNSLTDHHIWFWPDFLTILFWCWKTFVCCNSMFKFASFFSSGFISSLQHNVEHYIQLEFVSAVVNFTNILCAQLCQYSCAKKALAIIISTKSFAQNFYTKKALEKYWWNGHLLGNEKNANFDLRCFLNPSTAA